MFPPRIPLELTVPRLHLAAIRFCLAFAGAGVSEALRAESGEPDQTRVVVLEAREENEQVRLLGEPAGTHFDARGLVLYGGISKHFRHPHRFRLFSHPSRDPSKGIGYPPAAEMKLLELSNAERYPIQLRDMESPSISGFAVIGVQSRSLPWRVMKAMWDGDGLVVRGCRGTATVSNIYCENVEDGFGPQADLDYWVLRDSYLRYVRDDAVENDYLISGEISNCLVDGCFVFLSHRPDEPATTEIVTTVRDCLVHVQAQPHDGFEGREWRNQYIRTGEDGIGRSPGMLFKWSEGGGSVVVEDSLFLVDDVSASGPSDMAFPPGTYRNVTLIWMGKGSYPAALPEGVTLSRDLALWKSARQAWIDRLPDDHPASRLLENTPLPTLPERK